MPAGTDLEQGDRARRPRRWPAGQPVGGAFVRLLDATGEFTAEVVASASGDFRFFAAPGTWTLRALSRSGNGETVLTAEGPGLHTTELAVA